MGEEVIHDDKWSFCKENCINDKELNLSIKHEN